MNWRSWRDFAAGGGYDVYIYRHDLAQILISKYLWMAQIPIKGFIMPEVRERDTASEPFPIIPLGDVKSLPRKRNIRVIVAEDDCVHDQVRGLFRAFGITRLYFANDVIIQLISEKMMPRQKEVWQFEINLADHCDLNCQCCDHFSPLAEEAYLDLEQFTRDMRRMSELMDGQTGLVKLLGGEPLLNKQITEYMRVARECFPAAQICIITNGLLLPRSGDDVFGNALWEAAKRYEVEIYMTKYPIPLPIDKITEQAEAHGIQVTLVPPENKKAARFWICSDLSDLSYAGEKFSVKDALDLSGQQEKYRWISCFHFNRCTTLKEGKIYTCPIIAYSYIFNQYFEQHLEVKDDCYIDIYKAGSFQEITEFVTHRPSFCDYCAVHKRSIRPWKKSERSIDEWAL